MCVWEYTEENNSRGIYYYGQYVQKADNEKRKSIQDERVKAWLVIVRLMCFKKKTPHNILQYLTIPTRIDFKFTSCTSTGSIAHIKKKKEREICRNA